MELLEDISEKLGTHHGGSERIESAKAKNENVSKRKRVKNLSVLTIDTGNGSVPLIKTYARQPSKNSTRGFATA